VFIISLIGGTAFLILCTVIGSSSRPAQAWESSVAEAQAQAGTILISPTFSTVNVGESVTVTVWLSDVADYYGVDFHLTFDPTIVDLPKITPLYDVFTSSSFVVTRVTSGEVQYAVTNFYPTEPFTGTGGVCDIAFKALGPVSTTLHFSYTMGTPSDGDPLYPTEEDGEIEVSPTAPPSDIPLVIGWNLVSVPLIPPSTAITEVLSSIDGNYDLVYAYDSADTMDPWKKYNVAMPPFLNDLTDIDETMGFWIRVTETVTLTADGSAPTTTDIELLTGWNLMGYPGKTTQALTVTLQSIDGKYDLVYAYYPTDTSDPWKKYNVAMPPFLNDLTAMEPGHGYWLRATEDCTLTVDYE